MTNLSGQLIQRFKHELNIQTELIVDYYYYLIRFIQFISFTFYINLCLR